MVFYLEMGLVSQNRAYLFVRKMGLVLKKHLVMGLPGLVLTSFTKLSPTMLLCCVRVSFKSVKNVFFIYEYMYVCMYVCMYVGR